MPQAIVDYHYGLDAERYAFFRIPKIIMTEPYFDTMSTDAKMLYGLMLDRLSLSRENGWVDEDERVYIYFTIEDVCDTLHCKADKAVKLFAELDLVKGFGLIQQFPYDDLDEIVDLMLEVLCTQEDFIKIGKKQVYTVLARERFLKLDSSHIEYVLDCLRNTPSDIRNIKAYLLETLFNASATSGNYYKAKVNYDFHGTG